MTSAIMDAIGLTPTKLFWLAVPVLGYLFYRLAPLLTCQPKTRRK
jgi:hypothetical protein